MTRTVGSNKKPECTGPIGRRWRDDSTPRVRLRGGDSLLGGRPSAPGHAGRAGNVLLSCYEHYPLERRT